MQKYNFSTKFTQSTAKKDEFKYNPKKAIHRFYQICNFKNDITKQHQMRVTEIDELGNFIRQASRNYTDKELEHFFKTHRPNCYKLYSTNDIKLVKMPTHGDVNETQSELLNGDHTEYGFAHF